MEKIMEQIKKLLAELTPRCQPFIEQAKKQLADLTPRGQAFVEATFLQHPKSIGESYVQHLTFAFKTGGTLLYAGLVAILHGLVPKFHQTTASDTVCTLSEKIRKERNVP